MAAGRSAAWTVAALALALALAGPVRAEAPAFRPASLGLPRPPDGGCGGLDGCDTQANAQFSSNPITFYSNFYNPVKPEVGGKRTFTLYIANIGDEPIAKGVVVSLWANRTESVSCRQAADADAEYKLPQIAPFVTYTLKFKVPYSSELAPNATAMMRVFVDSTCEAFNGSSTENQYAISATVVAKGTEYFDVKPTPAAPQQYPYGYEYTPIAADQTPPVPAAGSAFSIKLGFQNLGTAPSPKGLVAHVFSDYPPRLDPCNTTGSVAVELPKIGPGKTKTVAVEGLVAPKAPYGFVTVLVGAKCGTGEPSGFGLYYYGISPSASAVFGGVQVKNQFGLTVKTAPKAPKANDTMTVKVKFLNRGTAEGAIGKVGLWIKPAADWNPARYGGYKGSTVCDYQGLAASADFSDMVVKPGKSKTVTIKDVPVPGPPGWWQVSALADINCTLPSSAAVVRIAPYTAFETI
ncbi:hypothetical protein Rsub_02500 [Raphidocelis subcapitata]|uniref:CARDB domain-containing protein n=1 Tax=Raphidocelis subcapitata TaxID=307507 RepID=A0A2V0NRY4_9CHLO|nr:hypothetical protein Rsub_02500 [Raphidocelis subcapitata]|eukprot:GBF90394.1 hypothetical protein Rsub_02500 [Raphidocelis subcapitata]